MTEPNRPVRVDQVARGQLLPWLAIFKTFRMAIRPSKLGVALAMLILVFVLGHGLDVVWGPQAIPGEVSAFGTMSRTEFETWRADQVQSRDARLGSIILSASFADVNRQLAEEILTKPNRYQLIRGLLDEHFTAKHERVTQRAESRRKRGDDESQIKQEQTQALNRIGKERIAAYDSLTAQQPIGIFRATFEYKFNAFDRLVQSAIGLRFGFGQVLAGRATAPDTVVGSLRSMIYILPWWLYSMHPGFLALLSVCVLLILALFGGTLARLAALDATGSGHVPMTGAFGFVLNRYLWFVITPLLPVIMIVVLGILLALGGLVFFNLPGLDMVGGFLFFIALGLGLAIAILLILTLAAYPLFYPALVMEGSDSFDAVSRSFGYLVNRPWHWFFYSVLSLVYGAVGYLFLGGVIYLTLSVTHSIIDMGVVTQMADETSRWHAIMPRPQLGQLLYTFDWNGGLGVTGKVTASMIWVWSFFLTTIIGAYTVSFFYCSNTVIYQLLRQSSEKTRMDEIVQDAVQHKVSEKATPDKVEKPIGEKS
ncbi:MAG TPA: hypothetical protein DER01_03120 [Phycisphaerales bacterium]|nr:hypothetical protein [Phycisphaerales bacterium]